jgi:hypothetical protein
MASDISELLDAYRAANAAAGALRSAKRAAREQRLAEFTKALDAELSAVHDAGINEAQTKALEADRAYHIALIETGRATLAAMGNPIREEWKRAGTYWSYKRPLVRSGRTGRQEVRDFDSKFPANRGYGLPAYGDIFMRILKKDGTPAATYESGYKMEHWQPVGWTPEKDAS